MTIDIKYMGLLLVASLFVNSFTIMLYFQQGYELEDAKQKCLKEIRFLLDELTNDEEQGIWK